MELSKIREQSAKAAEQVCEAAKLQTVRLQRLQNRA